MTGSDKRGVASFMGRKVLMGYGVAGLLIYLITAWNSIGYHHADEHFQILEFANFKLGDPGVSSDDLAWEYSERIRPGLQVLMAWSTMRLFSLFHTDDPFTVALFLRMLSAIVILYTLWVVARALPNTAHHRSAAHLYCCVAILLWFLPYVGVRFSSENWSGCLFFIGAALIFTRPNTSIGEQMLYGLILGLSFSIRYQSGIAIAGLCCWMILHRIKAVPGVLLGLLGGMGVGVLADAWLYGEWTFSAWRYFELNILEDRVSEFGTDPWYYYFHGVLEKSDPMIGGLAMIAMLFFWWKKRDHPFTWAAMPFFLAHMLISHKEVRFLFPLAPMLPLVLTVLLIQLREYPVQWKRVVCLILILDLPLLVYTMVRPASPHILALKKAQEMQWPQAVILYTEHDPYRDTGLPHHFYGKAIRISSIKVEDPEQMLHLVDDAALLWTDRIDTHRIQMEGLHVERLYGSHPQWITDHFNVNDWVSRTSMRALYLVKRL